MSSAGESGAGTFTQLLDKSIQNEALMSAWCPTMDLLALATTDGQVAVQRLIWQPVSLQQLWATAPDGVTTSLCWRPDGKALAVGLETGAVAILHVEDGEIIHRASHHEAPVVAISWVDPDIMSSVGDRARGLFPPPPTPLPDPAKVGVEPYTGIGDPPPQRWPALQSNDASLTVSVDSSGMIHICSFGTFLLASLDLFSLLDSSCARDTTRVLGASQSQDLQQLAVLIEQRTRQGQGGGSVDLAVLDTSVLATRGAELYQLALQATEILRLLEGAKQTLQEASAKWAEAKKQSNTKWTQLERLLADHASSSTPQQELLNLLACGFPSAALRQFLSSSLGEAGVKRLAKVVDSAVGSVHELLLDHLSPALELAAFRLGELRGIAGCEHWIYPLELEVDKLRSAELECLGLFLQTKQVLLEVTECGTLHRMFFLWLLRTLLLLNFDKLPQDTSWPVNSAEVVQFLQKYFQTDAIPYQLALDGTLSSMEQHAGNTYIQELQSVVLGKASPSQSLGRGLAALLDDSKHLFESISSSLASSIQLVSCNRLVDTSASVGCITSGNKGRASEVNIFVAVNDAASPGARCSVTTTSLTAERTSGESMWGLMGIVMPRQPTSKCVAASRLLFQGPAGKCVLDAKFYKDGKVAMLLGDENDTEACPALAVVDLSQFNSDSHTTLLTDLHVAGGGVLELPEEAVRMRSLPTACKANPLAVSGPRGVACVLTDQQRVLVLDLEEDEDEGDDDEEDDEDGEQ